MIARLEFDLPEDQHEFQIAMNGWKWRNILGQLDNNLRRRIKYDENKNSLDIPTLEFVRETIAELMSGENLSFD